MERTKSAWTEVGDRLEGLALKLQLHGQEELGDGEEAPAGPLTVRKALDRLGEALGQTAEALSDAAKDPAIHADLRSAAEAFAHALDVTLTETKDKLAAKRTS
jgi:predicted trehalose synthase